MEPCAVCGESFEEHVLLYGDRGRTCPSCVVEADEAAERSKTLWMHVAGPPVVALGAVAVACVPLVGSLMSLIMGCVALAAGLNAILVARRLDPDEPGVPDNIQTYLYVSGGVSALVSVGTVALFMLTLSLFVVFSLT